MNHAEQGAFYILKIVLYYVPISFARAKCNCTCTKMPPESISREQADGFLLVVK